MGDQQGMGGSGRREIVVVGVAGAGKTSYAMDVIEQKLRQGVKWHEIGFFSFSKAACREAAGRAAKLTGEPIERLTQHGWFRTLHSAALRCLGVDRKSVLDLESADGKKFLTEHLGDVRGGEEGTLSDRIDKALSWWDLTRAQMRMNGTPASTGVFRVSGACVMSGQVQSAGLPKTSETPVFSGVLPGHHYRNECRYNDRVVQDSTDATEQLDMRSGTGGHYRDTLGQSSDGANAQCVRAFSSMPGMTDATCQNSLTPIGEFRVENTQTHTTVGEISKLGCVIDLCAGRNPRVDARYSCSKKEEQAFSARFACSQANREMVQKYEYAKKLHGRLDFADLLMKFIGVRVDENLDLHETHQEGFTPSEVQVVLTDEAQDCSVLLDRSAERLSETAGEAYFLGDPYQAVYGFSGSDAALLAHREIDAVARGDRVLLNRSWRNPPQVIDWGEHILEQDGEYASRKPFSEVADGTVGLITWSDFCVCLGQLAKTDTMVIARTWWNLAKVKEALDLGGIPWMSCNEKMASRWSCPVKIGYALVMRALAAGEMISEQDWRRVTEQLNQKIAGVQMFERGAKARWKRLECSRQATQSIDRLHDWGASEGFLELVSTGRWKEGIIGAIDRAIDRFGVDVVRKPRVRIGTCHSVKGMEAEQVFCLAASTRKCAEGDEREELALKYVSVTRASRHYRLVVDRNDVARGKPLFWAAPKGEWTFVKGLPDDIREVDSVADHQVGDESGGDLGDEGGSGTVQPSGDSGSDTLRGREVSGNRGQGTGGEGEPDADPGDGRDQDGWWDVGGGSKFG